MANIKIKEKKKLFSALEVAKYCGVVNQTAINWIKSGYLKGFTTPGGQYRVTTEELVNFLKQRNMAIPVDLSESVGQSLTPSFLVIDDDITFNELVCTHLTREYPQAPVYQAFDGFEAGTIVFRVKPLFVILDMNLPGVNGITICRNIRKFSENGYPFILAISAMDTHRDLVLAEGARAFFSKPLDVESFLLEIRSCIKKGEL